MSLKRRSSSPVLVVDILPLIFVQLIGHFLPSYERDFDSVHP